MKPKKYNYQKVKEVCEEIWKTREHRCVICWKGIGQPYKFAFCHVAPKWQYPEYATDANNIVLACSIDHHKEVDILTAKHRPEIIEMLERGEPLDKFFAQ